MVGFLQNQGFDYHQDKNQSKVTPQSETTLNNTKDKLIGSIVCNGLNNKSDAKKVISRYSVLQSNGLYSTIYHCLIGNKIVDYITSIDNKEPYSEPYIINERYDSSNKNDGKEWFSICVCKLPLICKDRYKNKNNIKQVELYFSCLRIGNIRVGVEVDTGAAIIYDRQSKYNFWLLHLEEIDSKLYMILTNEDNGEVEKYLLNFDTKEALLSVYENSNSLSGYLKNVEKQILKIWKDINSTDTNTLKYKIDYADSKVVDASVPLEYHTSFMPVKAHVNIQYSNPYHTNGASNPSRYADNKEDFITYRIIALKDFGNVKAGDKGGYVADEHSLSQDGNCWVYDNGYIGYKAQVKDDALIKSGAKVLDFAIIKNKAIIDEHGIVLNSAIIKDKAHIKNGLVTANAVIGGNTIIDGYGMVGEDMIVLGNSIINSYARVGKHIENVILEDNQRKVTDYDAGKEKEYAARRVQNEIASWGISLKNDAGYASRLRKELILCKGAFGKFFSHEKGWYI